MAEHRFDGKKMVFTRASLNWEVLVLDLLVSLFP